MKATQAIITGTWAFLLQSCGDGGPTGPVTVPHIGQAATTLVAHLATDKITLVAYSLTHFGVDNFFDALGYNYAGLGGCNPTVAGDTTHRGGSRVANNATYFYTVGNCSYTNTFLIGSDTLTTTVVLTGSLHQENLASSTVVFGYTATAADLAYTLSQTNSNGDSSGRSTLIVTGTETVTAYRDQATIAADYSFGLGPENSPPQWISTNQSTLIFTPAVGAVIDPSAAFPAGTFTIPASTTIGGPVSHYLWQGGTGHDSTGAGSWDFTLSTPNGLGYSGLCASSPGMFSSGDLIGSISRTNVRFTVTFHPGCQDPTITTSGTAGP